MKYGKVLPCELIAFPNSSSMRQMLAAVPTLENQIRVPVATQAAVGATAAWVEMIIADDRDTAFLINDGNSASTKLRKFNFSTGLFTNPPANPIGAVRRIKFSPDKSKFFTSGDTTPFVEIWDSATFAKEVTQIANGVLPGVCYEMAFNPAGDKFAVASGVAPYFTIMNYPALTLDTTLSGGVVAGRTCNWSPDGNWVVFGTSARSTAPGSILLYDTATWTLQTLSPLSTIAQDLGKLSFNPLSDKIVACTHNGSVTTTLRIIDVATKALSNVTLPTGMQGSTSGNCSPVIVWLDNYKFFVSYNSTSFGMVGLIIDISSTPTIEETFYMGTDAPSGMFAAAPGFTYRRLAGTVVDDSNNPVSRVVRVLHRESGIFIAKTTSSGVDGTFEVKVFTSEPVVVLSMGSGTEITKLFDSVSPAPLI